MMRWCYQLPINILFSCLSINILANTLASHGEYTIDGHTVYYSVVNSTALSPQALVAMGLQAHEKYGVVVVATVPHTVNYGGIQTALAGTVNNLMQQRKNLRFKEVYDGGYYYLANFSFSHREPLNFTVHLNLPQHVAKTHTIKWSHRLFVEGEY